jgi:hypothetical protein
MKSHVFGFALLSVATIVANLPACDTCTDDLMAYSGCLGAAGVVTDVPAASER